MQDGFEKGDKMKLTMLIILLLSSPVLAGDDIVHEHLTTQDSYRWEIIQSSISVTVTFKVDKWTGKVWEIVRDSEGDFSWRYIPFVDVRSAPYDKIAYKIFTSGIQMRHTYLINVNNGATWLLAADSKKKNHWQLVNTLP